MRRFRNRIKWNWHLSDRFQTEGTLALVVAGGGTTVLELWAALFDSVLTLSVAVLMGCFLCLIAGGLCWFSGESSAAHIGVGVVSLGMGAGCAYLLRDVSGSETVMAIAGILLFTPGGAMIMTGRGDLDHPGV